MACSALLVSALVVGATGAPAHGLGGSGRTAQGQCCFNGCGDENSCVTGYCASQELCLKPQPDGGCDSSPPYGDGAKPSWCPAAAPQQLYSANLGDNVTANATVDALEVQSSCRGFREVCNSQEHCCPEFKCRRQLVLSACLQPL